MPQIHGRFARYAIGFFIVLSACSNAQQVADPNFKPKIEESAFTAGKGPVVLLDEAHYNFHTASGRYQPFADLLQRDGYVVVGSKDLFSKETLSRGKILVIANALSKRNAQNWNPPIDPSFTREEVQAVRAWVENGGALLLIADHFPMPAAISPLAEAFGVHFFNGYAVDPKSRGPIVFSQSGKSLSDHLITRGRNEKESVQSVATFTGSAFQIDRGDPILIFVGKDAFAYTPKAFGIPLDESTPRKPIQGWLQGATLGVGKGRIAIFGEAAMFSAQLEGLLKTPMGMNAPIAAQNPQFLLNVMHWLSGLLEK
jgi:hypothetical protein